MMQAELTKIELKAANGHSATIYVSSVQFAAVEIPRNTANVLSQLCFQSCVTETENKRTADFVFVLFCARRQSQPFGACVTR